MAHPYDETLGLSALMITLPNIVTHLKRNIN